MRPYQRSLNVQPMEVDARPPLSPQMIEVESNNYCHGAQKRPRPKKNVSFAEEALLYRSNRTTQDVEGMWYTKSQLATLKNERREIIRKLKKVNFDLSKIDQDRTCLRGYEAYFSVAMNKTTKYARDLVTSVVLVEQSRQRMLGIFDPEALSEKSSQASQWARDNGLELGTTDALLNPLRVECLGRQQHASDFWNGAQKRFSTVDDDTVRQLESTLSMVKNMLNECYR